MATLGNKKANSIKNIPTLNAPLIYEKIVLAENSREKISTIKNRLFNSNLILKLYWAKLLLISILLNDFYILY
jgi:hypothetical protein